MSKIFPNFFHELTVTTKVQKPLYSRLKKQLPDNFAIFSSVKWAINNSNSGHQETEADCIIISPHNSILVLKLVEGEISYEQGNWYSNNHLIPDPFQQSSEIKDSLLQYLKEHDLVRDQAIVVGNAVIFPDSSINGTINLNISQTFILDQPQLFNLKSWLKSVMSYWENQQQIQVDLSQESKEENITYDQQSFPISIISQKSMNKNSEPLIELSPEQLGLLEFLNHNNKVAINGCSDAGNTLLAIEQVNRLHQKGLSVLVISYQKSLTKYMHNRLGKREKLQINDCYEISKIIIKKALNHDINFKEYSNKKLLFNEILPTLLIRAIKKAELNFDAVIVTQGHKFNELWWLALKELLKNPEQGHFYLFHSSCKKEVKKHWYFPLQEAPYCLINHGANFPILDDCSQEFQQENSV